MDYENLNFDIHLKFVERKIVFAVGILSKLKCYLPKKILLSALSCINLSSSSLCDPHMGFYLQILSPQYFNSPRQNGIPGQTLLIQT